MRGKPGKREKNGGEKKKRMIKIVATTSLPAVDRPNADRWNIAHSCQLKQEHQTLQNEYETRKNAKGGNRVMHEGKGDRETHIFLVRQIDRHKNINRQRFI